VAKRFGAAELSAKIGEESWQVYGADFLYGSDHGNADLIRTYRSDIGLTMMVPVNFNEICPWFHAEVLP
jgi:hypothetical protein